MNENGHREHVAPVQLICWFLDNYQVRFVKPVSPSNRIGGVSHPSIALLSDPSLSSFVLPSTRPSVHSSPTLLSLPRPTRLSPLSYFRLPVHQSIRLHCLSTHPRIHLHYPNQIRAFCSMMILNILWKQLFTFVGSMQLDEIHKNKWRGKIADTTPAYLNSLSPKRLYKMGSSQTKSFVRILEPLDTKRGCRQGVSLSGEFLNLTLKKI